MARARGKPPAREAREPKLREGFGETFEEAVENALTPKFRRGESKSKNAEVIFTEVHVSDNPGLQYHVVVRFPEN